MARGRPHATAPSAMASAEEGVDAAQAKAEGEAFVQGMLLWAVPALRPKPTLTEAQRSALNTRCKLLLLRHAFETLNCIAVEFRTHFFNHQSRAAIERLGAKQDGVLRNHQVAPNGSMRDTVVYSILPGEWPAVRAHLLHRLERPA